MSFVISTIVADQDEQAQAGIDAFSLSQKTINQLREIFLSIDKLCQECQTLIDNHDHIKLLSNARNNLNTLKGMMSISVEAAEARESLNDDKELIHTFEKLIALDGKRRFALAAASSHKEEVGRLRCCYRDIERFEDVDRTWETVEKTIWGHIANFFKLAKESKAVIQSVTFLQRWTLYKLISVCLLPSIVGALRVVEMQEILDQQLAEEAAEAEGGEAMASIANRRRSAKYVPELNNFYARQESLFQMEFRFCDTRSGPDGIQLVFEDPEAASEEARTVPHFRHFIEVHWCFGCFKEDGDFSYSRLWSASLHVHGPGYHPDPVPKFVELAVFGLMFHHGEQNTFTIQESSEDLRRVQQSYDAFDVMLWASKADTRGSEWFRLWSRVSYVGFRRKGSRAVALNMVEKLGVLGHGRGFEIRERWDGVGYFCCCLPIATFGLPLMEYSCHLFSICILAMVQMVNACSDREREREREKRVQILSDLRELASAVSLDSFTLVSTNILQNHPDCPPEVVEKIVGMREGIPRKDAREVVEECRETYENSFVNGNPPKPGFVFGRVKCLSSKGSLWKKL
ncbi:exocyst complex component SEC6-like [Amborella trichopoda]|uniref:exocyst complex component SEC6-like n=1 Tax=Amborella trichopoda TaxID=13333 RepID=UPI0009BF4791|nr:exocyst complex component SEC6-like [Amborella trichopoda]|eukprot:XP_020527712.1 exocyst complex component SEC6-like [Amborella trichopoda]